MKSKLLYHVWSLTLALTLALSLALSAGCSSNFLPEQRGGPEHLRAVAADADEYSAPDESELYSLPMWQDNAVIYDLGYTDGCVSGKNALGDNTSKYKKNETKYNSHESYRSGWEAGYATCQEQYIAKIQKNVRQTVNLDAGSKEEAEMRNKIWDEIKK